MLIPILRHVYQREDGSITIKVEAMPTGNFDGWLQLFDLEDDGAPIIKAISR